MPATVWAVAALAWCLMIWGYLFRRRKDRRDRTLGQRVVRLRLTSEHPQL